MSILGVSALKVSTVVHVCNIVHLLNVMLPFFPAIINHFKLHTVIIIIASGTCIGERKSNERDNANDGTEQLDPCVNLVHQAAPVLPHNNYNNDFATQSNYCINYLLLNH